jgi:hypothetical protein
MALLPWSNVPPFEARPSDREQTRAGFIAGRAARLLKQS